MKTVAFFNNKGGVGKTSLVYHLAWMCADHGIDTLAVDLDPQANLTRAAAKLKPGESGLLALDWNNGNRTILVLSLIHI